MKRRILLITIVLSLLVLSSLLVVFTTASATTPTVTATKTSTSMPGADFSGTPLAGSVPLTVQFTALNMSVLSSCTWTFGDGTSQTFTPPTGQTFSLCPSTSHVYTTTGLFTVSLRVTKATNGNMNTMTKPNYIQVTNPGESTATLTRTPIPCGAIIVVTSTFTPTVTATPTRTQTATATSCGPIYQTATPNSPTLTPTITPQSGLPDLVVVSITEFLYIYPTATIKSNGCTSTPTWTQGLSVKVQNIGTGDAGSFVVSMNSSEQTVAGLAAGQSVNVSFILRPTPTTRTATADSTNLVVESDETNNSLMTSVTPGPTNTGTVPATVCKTFTPTQGTPVLTSTLTRTSTPTIVTPTSTPTFATPTPVTGACSPVTSSITAPFTFDGAGVFCWQSSNLGAFINSWNTTSVTINGVNITNVYIPSSSYPAKIGGFWYVGYNSSVAWGHFEAK